MQKQESKALQDGDLLNRGVWISTVLVTGQTVNYGANAIADGKDSPSMVWVGYTAVLISVIVSGCIAWKTIEALMDVQMPFLTWIGLKQEKKR